MRPSTFAAGLRQTRARLPRANVKSSRAFQRRQAGFGTTSLGEFFSGKRRQANSPDKFFVLVPQDRKEIDELRIQVVIGFHGRRGAVDQHGGRAAIHIAEMLCVVRQIRENEVQMYVFAAVPSERNHFPPRLCGVLDQTAGYPPRFARGFLDRFVKESFGGCRHRVSLLTSCKKRTGTACVGWMQTNRSALFCAEVGDASQAGCFHR